MFDKIIEQVLNYVTKNFEFIYFYELIEFIVNLKSCLVIFNFISEIIYKWYINSQIFLSRREEII